MNGSAMIGLADAPDVHNSGYCVDSSSNGGTACLLGTFSADLQFGFAYFTDLFVKFPGPNFTFRFHAVLSDDTILAVSTDKFNVLPHPPRISGIYFSVSFTHLVMIFDAPTNFANMKGSGNCAQLFGSSAVQAFAAASRCDWRDASTVWILLGNEATVNPGTCLTFKSGVVLYSTYSWIKVIQTDGVIANLPVNNVEAVNVDFQLTSPNMLSPLCYPVTLPVQLNLYGVLDSEIDFTISAVKHFAIESNQYFVMARYCSGNRCKIDESVAHTTAKLEINSSVYLWSHSQTNPFVKIQDIPTQGAVTLLLPQIEDTSVAGGLAVRQFLIIVNSQQKASRAAFALGAVDIYVWRDAGPSSGFEFRQEITYADRPVGADTISDPDGQLLVVVTTTRANVLRWVDGSFRASHTASPPLGWFAGQAFGWIPGQFLESIQDLPAQSPTFGLLHRQQDLTQNLYLAVADASSGGAERVFQWEPAGCIAGCFSSEPLASLPAVAPMSVGSFSAGGKDFLVVANFAEGSASLDQVPKPRGRAFARQSAQPQWGEGWGGGVGGRGEGTRVPRASSPRLAARRACLAPGR